MTRTLRKDGSNLIHDDPSDLNDLPNPGGALKTEATCRPTDEDQPPHPCQEIGDDDMLGLLLEALDGNDLRRTAMMMRAVYLRMDSDRETDLERLRQSANQTVTRL